MADPAHAVLWVGTAGEMEETLVPSAGLALETIAGGGLHGVGVRNLLPNAAKLLRGWTQARNVLRRFRPDVALLTGGYTNGPVALAAWEKRVPMVVFLPDIEPGLAIKTLGRLARRIACTTSASLRFLPASKTVVTGYPIRPGLMPNESVAEARAALGLQPDRPTLLVFGGSRGARTINMALGRILPDLLADYQVVHISGQLDWDQVKAKSASLPKALSERYCPVPYLQQRMGLALRAADLVVSRAGAATLGEFPAFGLPAILVPYPFAWRYQRVNADYLVHVGAAVRLDDQDMEQKLLPTIRRLLADANALERMQEAARSLHRPGAAGRIADLVAAVSARRGISYRNQHRKEREMILLDAWFWIMIVIFGIIGMLRGWTKEVVASAGLVLSLFALNHFGGTLLGLARDDSNLVSIKMETQFYIFSFVHLMFAFFSYQGPALVRQMSRGRFGDKARGALEESLLGFVIGAINGYLIVGTLWSFLEYDVVNKIPLPLNEPYPFAMVLRPAAGSSAIELVAKLPLPLLEGWLPLLVVLLFLFVIVAML